VGPKTGLDDVERRKILPLPGLELRPLGRPIRSQSLYRLNYPGSLKPVSCSFKAVVTTHMLLRYGLDDHEIWVLTQGSSTFLPLSLYITYTLSLWSIQVPANVYRGHFPLE
jgi:hypothetical protein